MCCAQHRARQIKVPWRPIVGRPGAGQEAHGVRTGGGLGRRATHARRPGQVGDQDPADCAGHHPRNFTSKYNKTSGRPASPPVADSRWDELSLLTLRNPLKEHELPALMLKQCLS